MCSSNFNFLPKTFVKCYLVKKKLEKQVLVGIQYFIHIFNLKNHFSKNISLTIREVLNIQTSQLVAASRIEHNVDDEYSLGRV